MNDLFRFVSIITIWIAVMMVLIVMFIASTFPAFNMADEFMLGLAGILGFAAAYSTARIAQAGVPASGQGQAEARAVKAKRHDSGRIARLVESLDEDEIVELETLLLSREEEYRN